MDREQIKTAYPLPALQNNDFGQGVISWRESGAGPCIVLLHGISSGSTAWAKQFNDLQLNTRYRLLAWDAPGYGLSDDLPEQQPYATKYALALATWLDGLKIDVCILVGHSLGALIASAYAAHYPARVSGLVLANPAQGYANANEEKRQQVFLSRQQQITELGCLGYAEQRSANLLRSNPLEADLQQVKYGMRRLRTRGFCDAAWMLANDDLHRYLDDFIGIMQIWCGELDTITPPSNAKKLALQYQAKFLLLPDAGHASYLDASALFNRSLIEFTDALVHLSPE